MHVIVIKTENKMILIDPTISSGIIDSSVYRINMLNMRAVYVGKFRWIGLLDKEFCYRIKKLLDPYRTMGAFLI